MTDTKSDDVESVDAGDDMLSESHQRELAMCFIFDAWNNALTEGVSRDMLASTAIFAAFSNMVGSYGEETVAEIATNLAERVKRGDFTVRRSAVN